MYFNRKQLEEHPLLVDAVLEILCGPGVVLYSRCLDLFSQNSVKSVILENFICARVAQKIMEVYIDLLDVL